MCRLQALFVKGFVPSPLVGESWEGGKKPGMGAPPALTPTLTFLCSCNFMASLVMLLAMVMEESAVDLLDEPTPRRTPKNPQG